MSGPQVIPGRLQTVLYDLGGEGVAYHDIDKINHGSGELNYTKGHCEDGVCLHLPFPRERRRRHLVCKEAGRLNHPSLVFPEWQQLYLGWEETGEWTNYTVDVKKAGRYKIVAMYSHTPNTVQFSLNNQPAADCKLPVDPWTQFPDRHDPEWMISCNLEPCRMQRNRIPQAGRQLLTLHYKTGNNLAYFDFVPVELK